MIFQEVIGSIYPWDLRDEGVEAILDNLQQRASCNMVYLIAVEIGHKRPITDDYYPHNPALLPLQPPPGAEHRQGTAQRRLQRREDGRPGDARRRARGEPGGRIQDQADVPGLSAGPDGRWPPRSGCAGGCAAGYAARPATPALREIKAPRQVLVPKDL